MKVTSLFVSILSAIHRRLSWLLPSIMVTIATTIFSVFSQGRGSSFFWGLGVSIWSLEIKEFEFRALGL